jgi:ubiquinone/menaquinone biosynthesis C-methylase UbiE
MSLLEEYKNQNNWRRWPSYIEKLPVKSSDTVLDFGCGIGQVTKLLSDKASEVIGIDFNDTLLDEARANYNAKNIRYINHDLKLVNQIPLPFVNGIWASFIAAYFPDFSIILNELLKFLKPGGWIAIVEINDLFGHHPISNSLCESFKEFYKQQRIKKIYDYEMGNKIKNYLLNENLLILNDEMVCDIELSFKGAADPQIALAWENRLNRLMELQ